MYVHWVAWRRRRACANIAEQSRMVKMALHGIVQVPLEEIFAVSQLSFSCTGSACVPPPEVSTRGGLPDVSESKISFRPLAGESGGREFHGIWKTAAPLLIFSCSVFLLPSFKGVPFRSSSPGDEKKDNFQWTTRGHVDHPTKKR